ncbi:transcriptional regulator family: Fungal Specific TF [Penicillium roqueforti]|nr:transcriptional regulator family: Fungal Specific TF [Penicillium roqueforti]KAI2674406.1 transcriptional regulator family: Fungal Specific TF [Penicillium roqueforti]KAI2710934.1 transcriptional regulator family: Fungal Specific TF [Penicillium roqueforti]KAI2714379.1 transcriptional regulator family: Fungal Specific TF [Penicillium roqueforti]KAI3147487.1 transcriptional regulator family: Fungal Specific TF [Penicillium roqueforti]
MSDTCVTDNLHPTQRLQSDADTLEPSGQTSAEFGDIDNSQNSIDGMGAIKFTDEKDCGFFGPSSNISFLQYISQAVATVNSQGRSIFATSPLEQRRRGIVNVSKPVFCPAGSTDLELTTFIPGRVDMYALPSEERTWDLIQQFFQKTGQLLPFIHESSFCETYRQMKRENSKGVRRTWLGLLNIILAISTSLSAKDNIPAEIRIQQSDIYYQRANSLCDRESRRNASLEMVQYLLILGQYLQGTQKSVQAWTTHGLAISVAYQLGLHSPHANQGFSSLECEIRKRTWFGCILLDRSLSMTFGRPCTIPESYVKLKMPSADMQILTSTIEARNSSQLDGLFFTAAIQLYSIMFSVLDSCYGQNLGFEAPFNAAESTSCLLKCQLQLNSWRLQLLPSLGFQVWDGPMEADDVEKMGEDSILKHRFNIVLSMRYNNLKILLHRRRLESFMETSPAAEPITIHRILTSNAWRRELLGAWNYSLYYTFNAALVIFGSLIVALKKREYDMTPWNVVGHSRPYTDRAIDALRRLDSGNRVVGSCVEYLSHLSLVLSALGKLKLCIPSYALTLALTT